jgi:hypothetical protein
MACWETLERSDRGKPSSASHLWTCARRASGMRRSLSTSPVDRRRAIQAVHSPYLVLDWPFGSTLEGSGPIIDFSLCSKEEFRGLSSINRL